MNEDNQITKFFQDLESNIDDLDFCIRLCENNIKAESAELSVISMSALRVFEEIRLYLEYFNSEIAKKFGFRGTSEWGRIKSNVLENFAQEIEERDLSTQSTRLRVADDLIKKWTNFPREKETNIMNRELENDTFA